MDKNELAKLNFTGQVSSVKTYGWYEFRQNNSGGGFDIDEDVSVYVLIQATSYVEANNKAEDIGIYFDGCDTGRDCDCCGDRWDGAGEALDKFTTYTWKAGGSSKNHKTVRDYAQALANNDCWAEDGEPSVIVYFADDSKELFYREKVK